MLLLVIGLMMAFGAVAEGELVFSSLTINGQTVDLMSSTVPQVTLKSLDNVQLTFKLKNNLTTGTITGMLVELQDGNVGDDFAFSFTNNATFEPNSLNAGSETVLKTLTEKVPGDVNKNIADPAAISGTYRLKLVASGTNIDDSQYSKEVPFDIIVKRDPADLVLTAQAQGSNTITCGQPSVKINLTNRGSTDENDIKITVKEGTTLLWDSYTATGTNHFLSASRDGGEPTELDNPITLTLTGQGSHTLTVEAGFNYGSSNSPGSSASPQMVTFTKNSCLTSTIDPTDTSLLLVDGASQLFKVTVSEASAVNNIQWSVTPSGPTGSVVSTSGAINTKTYTFPQKGDFVVKAELGGETKQWNVKVTDVPLSLSNSFEIGSSGSSFTSGQDLSAVTGFFVKKQGTIITFTDTVDLREVANVDGVVTISGNKVAVDSTILPALQNKKATITLPQTFTNPLILKADIFAAEPDQPCNDCVELSNGNGAYVFTVQHFSAYKVVEEQPAAVEIVGGELLLSNATRDQSATLSITLRNKGTYASLTNLVLAKDINTKYEASLSNLQSTTLAPGATTTVTLTFKVPEDEAGGKHSIGSLKVTSTEEGEKTFPIYIQPKSFLAVTEIEVDGSTSGDLLLDEVTKISVTVENQHTKDMNDVRVTVRILDTGDDGDEDLEKESESFDLDDGKEKTLDFEFDLTEETLDEDSYDVEITVEGEDEANVDHETVEVKKFNVKRENHHLILKALTLGSAHLECNLDTTLQVTVENVGKNDEDEVEVRVKNAALNLNLRETDLEVNKFSDSNNDERVSFALDFSDAEAGTYPLTVEVYRDGSLEESKEVTVTVGSCGGTTAGTGTGSTTKQTTDQIAQQLQQALVDALSGEQNSLTGGATAGTFRESAAYVVFLAVIGALLLTAVVLSLAVLGRKR